MDDVAEEERELVEVYEEGLEGLGGAAEPLECP